MKDNNFTDNNYYFTYQMACLHNNDYKPMRAYLDQVADAGEPPAVRVDHAFFGKTRLSLNAARPDPLEVTP